MGIAASNISSFPVSENGLRNLPLLHGGAYPEEPFWRQLERLNAWRHRNMRFLDLPQGEEVLIWLLKGGERLRPLKDLYRGSRFSEPTVRLVLRALADDGFITIERNCHDRRVCSVQLNSKILRMVEEYMLLLCACGLAPMT
jgi:DNA-binding MarR family transcriptional regulator